jgi:hypothetical protein
MAQCKNHPDREAEATCAVCGAPICSDCIAPGGEEPVCFDCSIAMAREDLDQEAPREAAAIRSAPAAPRSRLSPGIKILMAVGVLIILGELAIILFMGPPKPGGGGAPPGLDPAKAATLDAVTQTIVVTQTLETYRAKHGRYPASLSDIAPSLPAPVRQRLDEPGTRYSVDDTGAYHLELQGGSRRPVMAGSSLKAPVLKPDAAESPGATESPEGGTP